MFVAVWQRKILLILILFPIATRPNNEEIELERLMRGLARLQKSPYLQNLTSTAGPAMQLAMLKAMYHDPEYRQAMQEEPRQIRNDCRARNHYIGAFKCQPLKPRKSRPTKVHDLTPADIEVVGALGDSFTTGTGAQACTIMDAFTQYRGLGFSIGGEGDFHNNPTLVNILRVYNPHLVGFSLNEANLYDYNVANSGATSWDLMSQAQLLVQRMRQQLSWNRFHNSWKLVTIHMGFNDLCSICLDGMYKNPDLTYGPSLSNTLDYLQANLPRTLVVVIPPLNTGILPQLRKGLVCTTMHHFMCKCGSTLPDVDHVNILSRRFLRTARFLFNRGTFDRDPQFAFVLRPITFDISRLKKPDGSIDMSYFGADCLHFSAKGQAAFAQTLWNSLFHGTVGEEVYLKFDDRYVCPDDEMPSIRTAGNAQTFFED